MGTNKIVEVDEGLLKHAIKTANAMFNSSSSSPGIIVERQVKEDKKEDKKNEYN